MENDNLENIFLHAWNKDAVNLRSSLDSELQSRISTAMDSMVADVSASLFGATSAGEVPPVADNTDSEG
jgi:hypothetical protein